MVEIKKFKQFLLLFFSFQLLCTVVGGGSCQRVYELTETVQKEREKGAWRHTCAISYTHAPQRFYTEHLGKREPSQKTVIVSSRLPTGARCSWNPPAWQNRGAIRSHWCIKSVELFGEYWSDVHEVLCVFLYARTNMCVRACGCARIQMCGRVF